ncbi:MAG: alpha-glucosidase C-terminal domain-containing protein [Bacteroidetes bacterium]|nr:alpha-glucosidase C-terminal domain-containing protein [Bacteroidota bacterium]
MKKLFILLLLSGFSLSCFSQEIIYHIFQRSFFDSNQDGHGDLRGIQQKLDYLQELGVTSLLLTPLYQSEFYHNYFATDFEKIDKRYGSLDDYLALVREAHKRGFKIYQDVEMQYVTDKHPWYISSFNNLQSPYAKYIYYHDSLNQKPFFFYNIPEFVTYNNLKQKIAVVNMHNPAVRQYTLDVLTFWADPNKDGKFDDGVDGFRLDHMMDDLDNFKKLPDLFTKFWTPVITGLKKVNPNLLITAEQANWFSLGREYFRQANVDRVFAFYLSWAIEKMDKKELLKAADSTLTKNPGNKNQIVFLENHDTRRIASAKGMTIPKLKCVAALNLFLGGVPLIYYGQELGMKGKQMKGPTDGNDIPIREAFEWTANATGKGMALWYKNTGPWWDSTYVKPYDGISLEEEKRDPHSLWSYYRQMIHLRKSSPALSQGRYRALNNENDKVFSFLRYTEKEEVAVVINLSGNIEQANVSIDSKSLTNLLSKKKHILNNGNLSIQLQPYEVQLYKIQ